MIWCVEKKTRFYDVYSGNNCGASSQQLIANFIVSNYKYEKPLSFGIDSGEKCIYFFSKPLKHFSFGDFRSANGICIVHSPELISLLQRYCKLFSENSSDRSNLFSAPNVSDNKHKVITGLVRIRNREAKSFTNCAIRRRWGNESWKVLKPATFWSDKLASREPCKNMRS